MIDRNLQDRIAELERRVDAAEARPVLLGARQDDRLAMTMPYAETGDYPHPSQRPRWYYIVFVDGSEPPEDAEVFTAVPRQAEARVRACNLAGDPGYVPQGTVLIVRWQNNCWWFSREAPRWTSI